MNETVTIQQVKDVIANQLMAEKQMGADERDMTLLTAVLADVVHLLEGGYIVGGVRL
jgi:hypothetical protein